MVGAILGLWTLTWNLGSPVDSGVWFGVYAAIVTYGLFFVLAFLILSAWAWTTERGQLVRIAARLGLGLVVVGLVYGVLIAPLAWALFEECLMPNVEYQGECRYKP